MFRKIRTPEDLTASVSEFGFLPFFSTEIVGFSIDDLTPMEVWGEYLGLGPWLWRDEIAKDKICIYGKFFGKKTGYVYFASGGDMGRGVTCCLAANHPGEVKGIHLTDVGFAADLVAAPDDSLTPDELDYKRRALDWQRMEGAYIQIQSTKPQTLAFALSDSPAGMAAWLVEKYHAWSD